MNIKRNISKLVSGLLCFSMVFGNVLPAYAADAVITENTLDGEDLSVDIDRQIPIRQIPCFPSNKYILWIS